MTQRKFNPHFKKLKTFLCNKNKDKKSPQIVEN